MNTAAPAELSASARTFHHEALFYEGHEGFLTGTLSFLRQGLANGEPALVVVDRDKIAALRDALGDDGDRVQFADMARVGRNPARIIHRWQRFVADHGGPGRPVRGIGEPIWPERGPAELVECQAHETLLNVAFADGPAWSLLCPYDVGELEPVVVEEARRSHPYLTHGQTHTVSEDYLPAHPSPARFELPLPPAPPDATAVSFGPGAETLHDLRTAVHARARQAGLAETATQQLLVAANEAATNSIRHGGGRGTVRLWRADDKVVCQVDDHGRISAEPLLGRLPPAAREETGRGLWLANQLCHLVQVRATSVGTTVRLHMDVGDAAADGAEDEPYC